MAVFVCCCSCCYRLPGVQARASQQVHRGGAGLHGVVQHLGRLRPGRGKRSEDLLAKCEEHHVEADAEIEQRQCGHSDRYRTPLVPNGTPPRGTATTSCNNINNNNIVTPAVVVLNVFVNVFVGGVWGINTRSRCSNRLRKQAPNNSDSISNIVRCCPDVVACVVACVVVCVCLLLLLVTASADTM